MIRFHRPSSKTVGFTSTYLVGVCPVHGCGLPFRAWVAGPQFISWTRLRPGFGTYGPVFPIFDGGLPFPKPLVGLGSRYLPIPSDRMAP